MKHYFKIFLSKGFKTFISSSLLLASVEGLAQSAPLVGFTEDQLAEDEAGLWMVVEKQEQNIRTSSILIDDFELESRINNILCDLVKDGCSFLRHYLIRAPGFNAFMMPNGAFFIQSGLLLRIQNDDQLASVIGHEASHYFRSHSIERMRETFSKGNTLAVLGAIVSAASAVSINSATSFEQLSNNVNMSNTAVMMLQTAQIIAALQLLEYSRDNETEADLDSVEWMSNTEFDLSQSVSVWRQMISEQASAGNDAGLSLLSTHPASEQRIQDLTDKIRSLDQSNISQVSHAIVDLVSPYREEWLLDEMRVLHPDQFVFVANLQLSNGMPEYLIKYLSAMAYVKALDNDYFSRKDKREFSGKAFSFFDETVKDEKASNRPEIFREFGKLNERLENPSEAKEAYSRYLELAPDAWDARFIKRKL